MVPVAISTDAHTRSQETLLSLPTPPISLQFNEISYRIKITRRTTVGDIVAGGRQKTPEEKMILDGITGEAAARQFLAVLGPSGSGKSTLLAILAGRFTGHHGGAVLANGCRVSRAVSRRIGFVPQDDMLYPHLTVRETLTYCAMLRLPRSGGDGRMDRVREAVDAVLGELGLAVCADTAVGGTLVRGVSGGERKRVSIGHEMLLNPSVVVVDEPTSGLDATAAGRVVEILAGMARRGRTIIASVHQPSSRAYQLFDSLLLLADGRCLYFGRGSDAVKYFVSVGFSPGMHVNPADFMLDLANGVTQIDYHADAEEKADIKQSLISSYNTILAPVVKASITTSAKTAALVSERSVDRKEAKDFTRISWFCQFSILLRRSLKERRHEAFNYLRIVQVIASAFLAGSMWWHSSISDVRDRLGLLFFVSIFWGVFASVNAVFIFPQELPIFTKERTSGMYSLSSYFFARMVGDLHMELILPSVFIVVLYWMAGLRPEPGAFFLTLLVLLFYVLVAQGLGLALGAVIMDAKRASAVATITMLAFLMTGGFYVQNVPRCMEWLKYASFTFYCFRLLIGVQYRANGMRSYLGIMQKHQGKFGSRETAIEGQASIMLSVLALGIMFVGYRFLAYAALRRIKV